mmetsp:Transcript_23429/g.32702  ORF Transcript_23429/g.32702 Transcript_23429/m.32702 type:complete len:82 (-) Transcript_23429:4-249(-)
MSSLVNYRFGNSNSEICVQGRIVKKSNYNKIPKKKRLERVERVRRLRHLHLPCIVPLIIHTVEVDMQHETNFFHHGYCYRI